MPCSPMLTLGLSPLHNGEEGEIKISLIPPGAASSSPQAVKPNGAWNARKIEGEAVLELQFETRMPHAHPLLRSLLELKNTQQIELDLL